MDRDFDVWESLKCESLNVNDVFFDFCEKLFFKLRGFIWEFDGEDEFHKTSWVVSSTS